MSSTALSATGLIYRTSQGLWTVATDGQDVHLFDRTDDVLSPDGHQVLYSEDDDIWLASLISGERRNLTQTPDRRELAPAWWPSRPDLILFASQALGWFGMGLGPLAAVGLDGLGYGVMDEERCAADDYDAAPDGQTIACGGMAGWLYEWDGTGQPLDPDLYGLTPREASYRMGSPSWSPDGQLLAYAAVRATTSAEGDGASLERTLQGRASYVMDVESGKVRQLTDPVQAIDGWPNWRADGERFLYARITRIGGDAQTEVRTIRLDGEDDLPLLLGLPGRTCYHGGCQWSDILSYYPDETADASD